MIITILLAGLLLILAAGIRCGFALDDLIRMAVNGIKKAVNILIVLAIVGIMTACGVQMVRSLISYHPQRGYLSHLF